MLKRLLMLIFSLTLISNGTALSQQQAPPALPAPSQPQVIAPQVPPPPQLPALALPQPQVAAPPSPGLSPQQLTPQQVEILRKLTPEQRKALESEAGKTGGTITPQAIETLKTKPEFKGLSPEDVLKGKELLEKKEKEAEKKEPEEKKPPILPEKKVIGEEPKGKNLFERYRDIGKYQDISTALKPFGYDFFAEAGVRVITDRKDIPVPAKYVIGPGDEVKILLWGRVNAQYSLIVDRNGNISVPQIGPLQVAGMTFERMSDYLNKQAAQIVGAKIDITMGALKTIPIFVLGDVRRPGAYTIGSFATILDALLMAGGSTEIGSMRKVELRRNNQLLTTFDLYDLLLRGDKSQDKILQAGDIIFVPVIGSIVGIAGNVKRPAIYELKGENDLYTLFDLAGGIIPTAYTQQIQVERIIKGETQIVVDINDKTLSSAKRFILQDGDLVKVFPIVDKDINAVYLVGNVKRPGKYELKPGMRIKDLIKDSSELLPETYFEYALIKRLHPPGLETSLVPINLTRVVLENDPANNVELVAQDYVYIFSRWFFQDKPLVTIEGEVRAGGKFDLALNMKTKDAILTAGDVTKDAYLPKGEIIRVNKKREYQTIYFNVAKAIAEHPGENLPLQNEDRIIIHSIWEERWKEMVSIVGEVKNPSEILLTESMKISDLIFKAKGLTRDSYLEEAELYRTDWRTKEVSLQRVSLKKALEGDPDHNIQLKDLDTVVVHSIWENIYKKIVSVDGDVKKPGTYQYAQGMTVKDLVFAAGNVLESAHLEEAEISSQVLEDTGGTKIEHRSINFKRALQNDPRHNLLLKPYDRLYVKRIPDWRKENFVTLTGEVTLPGKYIIKKGERLSALLARAKGLTLEAYLPAAFFTRESVRKAQQKRIQEFIEEQEQEIMKEAARATEGALSKEDAEQRQNALAQRRELISRLKAAAATGRVVVKLLPLEKFRGSEYDIELEEGDSLHIPPAPSTVMVMGRVYNPNAILYTRDRPLEYYLNKVGGTAENADEKRIYLVRSDGSVISRTQEGLFGFRWDPESNRWTSGGFMTARVDPGDTILVPEKYERIYWTKEIKDWTQIIFQIAVTAGVLAALY